MLSNSPINGFFAAGGVNVQERERERERERVKLIHVSGSVVEEANTKLILKGHRGERLDE